MDSEEERQLIENWRNATECDCGCVISGEYCERWIEIVERAHNGLPMEQNSSINEDQIFYSDSEYENEDLFEQFISSPSEIVTIASDSDITDSKVYAPKTDFNIDGWADIESETDNSDLAPLTYKSCITCRENPTTLLQCTECWTNKTQNTHRPKNKKPKRKKLLSKDTTPSQLKNNDDTKDLCQICLSNTKNGGFIHGNSCHYYGCYICCKTIFEQSGKCPFCNRIIEKIVKVHC